MSRACLVNTDKRTLVTPRQTIRETDMPTTSIASLIQEKFYRANGVKLPTYIYIFTNEKIIMIPVIRKAVHPNPVNLNAAMASQK